MKRYSCLLVFVVIACGCGSSGEMRPSKAQDSTASTASHANLRKRTNTDPSTAIEQRVLAADEMRVSVAVFPGDAFVEVDKVPVRRRHGMVEFVGKVGQEHKVEAFLGSNRGIEFAVKIEATGASPAFFDVREALSVKSGPGKAVAEFNNDE